MTPREINRSIIAEACEAHGVSTASIMGISRAQSIAFARQHCYWKMWKAGMSFTDIGKVLNRDRTTVRHGVAMIARAMHCQARAKELGL